MLIERLETRRLLAEGTLDPTFGDDGRATLPFSTGRILGSQPDGELLAGLARTHDADFLVAGGVSDLDGIRRLRDIGVTGIILGQALLSGAIDYAAALEAAA